MENISKSIKVALVGQPNVGKSSLVNSLSGANIRVGNFTGTTVEMLSASLKHKGYEITLIDLPGTYSLSEYSQEERVTKSYLLNEKVDVILNVVDSTNLERNLILSATLLELNQKMLIALNMSDEAKKEGISIDTGLLSGILGVNTILVSASSGENLQTLLDTIVDIHTHDFKPGKRIYGDVIELEIQNLTAFLDEKKFDAINDILNDTNTRFKSHRDIVVSLIKGEDYVTQLLHNKTAWVEIVPKLQESLDKIYSQSDDKNTHDIFINDTYSFAKGAATETCKKIQPKSSAKSNINQSRNHKIDAILLNKIVGIPIFLFFMWALFQLTFLIGGYPQGWIEDGFGLIGELSANIENPLLSSFVSDGVIGGVGAVLAFLPNILILFFGIFLLEGTGYMARVAFLLDGFFHKFGLHGKSFIPLVSGFGCSIPAFMSARVLKNHNDRMLTLFIINFMSCSARLPVYVLFVSAFFSPTHAGNALFAIYIFGAIIGLILAKILKLTVFKGDDEPFVMEMPKYRMPSLKLILFSVWLKAKMFIKKAGTFILLTSIIVWAASSFPQNSEILTSYDEKITTLESSNAPQSEISALEYKKEQKRVENSYLGKAGEFISPIFAPMDFDWKMSVAMISGLAAKEVIISTLGVLYSLGSEIDEDESSESSMSLQNVLKNNISMPSAIAFIMFVMFYNPCLAASVVFGKEAGGRKYMLYLFIFTSIVSYFFATLGYYVASLFV